VAGAILVGWLLFEKRELRDDEARALAASYEGAPYEVDPSDLDRQLEIVDRCFHGHDARACATHFRRLHPRDTARGQAPAHVADVDPARFGVEAAE
jgi:hypothetical protein